MRRLIPWLVALALVVLGLWTVAFLLQDRLIWFPGPPPSGTPAGRGLAYEELTLAPEPGVRLHAWLIEPAGEPRGAVSYSHGNAGNVEGRLGAAAALVRFGWAVLLYDYRGYGGSTGEPSEEGTYADALAAYDALVARGFPPERIVSFGESLGAGPAIEVARRRPVGGVIIESAFTSLVDVGRHHYPFLPVGLLARTRYDNLAKLPELRVPLLVIHGRDDEIVPFEQGRRLFEAAHEPRAFLATDGGHDGGTWLREEAYRERVGDFLGEVEARAAEAAAGGGD